MRKTLLFLSAFISASHAEKPCPKDFIRILSVDGRQYHVIVTDKLASDTQASHCSRIWPNEQPEITLIPSPPGCLYYGSAKISNINNRLPMHIPSDGYMHFVPESEAGSLDQLEQHEGDCDGILSVTTTKSKRIIVAANCTVPHNCRNPRQFKASASCDAEEEASQFLESAGWHRSLGAALHVDIKQVAFQWLPREFFADPDELSRKTNGNATSVSDSINIENPSLISPPQIVRVDRFPFPLHARVNPPHQGEEYFISRIPKAVWVVPAGTIHCAVEKGSLASLVKLDSYMRLKFMDGFALLKTKVVKGGRYASTEIPSGNPDDLFLAVVTSASTAVVGALAIIIASLRK